MVTRNIWKPVICGGFVGIVLGTLWLIATWTSAYQGICAQQFTAIVGCAIGVGIVWACGAKRSLAWLFSGWRRSATGLLLVLSLVAVSCRALLDTTSTDIHFRFQILFLDWLLILSALIVIGPKVCDTRMRRWSLAFCDTVVALYGPAVVDLIYSLCFGGFYGQVDVFQVLAAPGGAIVEAIRWVPLRLADPDLVIHARLFSAMMTFLITLMVAQWPRWRWWLPVFFVLWIFGIDTLNRLVLEGK